MRLPPDSTTQSEGGKGLAVHGCQFVQGDLSMTRKTEVTETNKQGERSLRAIIIMSAVVLVLAAAAGVAYFSGLFGVRSGGKIAVSQEEKAKYTCGMHPWIIQEKPGSCPVCGMTLTKVEGKTQPSTSAPATPQAGEFFAQGEAKKGERKILYYRNPMNPSITSPVPAKDEMGMDFVPVYSDEVAPPGGVEGLATVRVGEESLHFAGIQTTPAKREKVTHSVRTVGIVTADERRIRHVHTKISGWIDKLFINFTGEMVGRGKPILSLYSPELLASQEEFLQARETAAKFATSSSPDVQKLGQELLQSARRRLQLFDVPEGFIAELERTGTPRRTVTLNAPVSGYVLMKGVFEGQQVEPGMELFNVTDLSKVWIEADLYEYETSSVRVGQEASLTLTYDPGVQLRGKVAYVFPYLSPESRTLKVRFDFPNPKLTLKPAMYVDVSLALTTAEGVAIPDSALIDTGIRQVVFVETSPGTFEPRLVKTGIRGEGKVQLLVGVKEGEKVVIRANFLLDSESKLRAAFTKMTGSSAAPGGQHGQHGGGQ